MSRSLVRRGASVLLATALLGGGVALGVGTASAEEVPSTGSADLGSLVDALKGLGLGSAGGCGMSQPPVCTEGFTPEGPVWLVLLKSNS